MAAILLLILILQGSLACPAVTWASPPEDQALMQKVIQNVTQENYEEALQDLKTAWQQGPKTAEKAYLFGMVYRKMMRYPKARGYLEEALRLKPSFPQARLMLADTLVALNKPEEAEPLLLELQRSGYEPGQTAFLRGMVAYNKKEFSDAVQYFRQAEEDPQLAQEAKFQESMALAAQNRLVEARKAMEAATELNPQSPLAGLAQGYVAALDVRLKEESRFRFFGGVGFDYDSNVTLAPGGPTTGVQLVTGKADWFYNQSARLEYNLIPHKPFSLWAQYSYYQNFHFKISELDLWSNTLGLVPAYTWPNSRFWMPFTYNYTDVGSSKYFTSFNLSPTYLHLYNDNVGVEVGLNMGRNYYWFPIFLQEDDRSGRYIGGSLAYYYFIKNQTGYFQARFSYTHDFTAGSNWENNSYSVGLSSLYPINPGLRFRGFVDLTLQQYLNKFFNGNPLEVNPPRRDKILVAGVEATKDIYKGLEFNVHYYYIRDNSSIPIYNYSRHIVGCQLGYRY
jgi:tetratricopeptide (TPR) repeat protein